MSSHLVAPSPPSRTSPGFVCNKLEHNITIDLQKQSLIIHMHHWYTPARTGAVLCLVPQRRRLRRRRRRGETFTQVNISPLQLTNEIIYKEMAGEDHPLAGGSQTLSYRPDNPVLWLFILLNEKVFPRSHVCSYECECVCERERWRERERACVCVRERESACVYDYRMRSKE